MALLAIGLLLVTAEPWKVLWGFALSGAHLDHFLGWDPQTSSFWSSAKGQALLQGPGDWLFNPAVLVDLRLVYSGGGLLASGCNVNAFLGGVMSFSLHGWIWLAAALLGFASSLRLSGGFEPVAAVRAASQAAAIPPL